MRQISLYLTLNHSRDIRETLRKNGFAIYKVNSLLKRFTPEDEELSNLIFLNEDEEYNGFVCIYNGEKSLEEMGINRGKLENREAVRGIREFFYKQQKPDDSGTPRP